MAERRPSAGSSALNQVDKNYKYGGDSAIGALFLPERREILQEEQNQLIGYDDRGQAIVQTIPAQYGESEVDFSYSPIVRGAKATGSFLNDIFFGDANEQSEAAGRAVSAIRGVVKAVPQMIDEQMRAAGSGGRYYDPETRRIVEFDPTIVMGGGSSGGGPALASGFRRSGGREGTAIAGGSALRESFRIGDEGFDPRFDSRVLEQDRIANTQLDYNVRPFERPDVSIFDLEGKPFRLTMSDRTAAGRDLTGVEGVQYDIPINLQGGQDFMFSNPLGREGQVWAQDKGSTSKYLNSFLGLDGQPISDEVLMLPFRMAPTGGDFATMTSELMVTHARNNVSAKAKKQADKRIREFYPEWKGIDNPESLQQISNMKGDPRKALIDVMDKDLRNEGGLGIGQARLAVSDRSQYNALDTGLQNVGIATTDIASVNRRGRPTLERFEDSGHRTYAQGLSGRPMGSLIEQDVSAYELLPDYVVGRGFRNFEDLMNTGDLAAEAFTLRRGTRGGVITEDMLRDIEARRAN
jgi:hypothetical protein